MFNYKIDVMEGRIIKAVKNEVKYWWVSLLVGILALILGVWSLITPDTTLVAMTWVFIIIFLISGIMEIVFAVSNHKILLGWGWLLAGGIIEILFSLLLMMLPTFFLAATLVYIVGFWMLFRSIWAIGESTELQMSGVKGWGWTLVGAILMLLFSFFFLLSPAIFKGIYVVALISVAFFIYGIFRIYLSFRFRSIYKDIKKIENSM